MNRSRRVTAFAATILLLGAVAACGGGSSDDAGGAQSVAEVSGDDAGTVDPAAPGDTSGEREGGDAAADEDGSGANGANRAAVQTRAVIRTGTVAVVTKNIPAARDRVDDLVTRYGGYLASEETRNDRAGRPQHSLLVLRVPEPAFDAAMKELGRIGRLENADRSSEDVTTEVIDVDTRVATQEASLERLQRFMDRAKDIDDVIRLESEIATRQAALESLKAQQKYLSDQTAMSTVTLRMRAPAAQAPEEDEEAGFLAGLHDGWTTLKTVLLGLATAAGVFLPFAVTLAVLGVPTWLLVRVARRRQPAPVVPPAPDAG